jgi:hypothetical protein
MFTTFLKFSPALAIASCFSLSAIAADPTSDAAPTTDPVALTDLRSLPETTAAQISSITADKASWNYAQRKISANLIVAARMEAGLEAFPGVPTLETGVQILNDGMTEVDIRAEVTPDVVALVQSYGGEIMQSFAHFKTIKARMPIGNVELLAYDGRIRAIRQPKIATLESAMSKKSSADADLQNRIHSQLSAALTGSRFAAVTPTTQSAQAPVASASTVGDFRGHVAEGDIRHRARTARLTYGIDGTGLKIGILSDSFNAKNGYANETALGDLPGPGNPNGFTQTVKYAGSGDYFAANASDEGRAMAQIIHALLPGAELYYATAFKGSEDFANNILALRGISPAPGEFGNVPNGGCDIIVDDVGYSEEPALRDGATKGVDSPTNVAVIKQAVNDVVAHGALYFSSAKNSGNKNDNQSGTWEGDFVDGGAVSGALATTVGQLGKPGGRVHNWNPGGTADTLNTVTVTGNYSSVEWSDPLGSSANDYDIYTLNAAGTVVVGGGFDVQDGDDDPTEGLYQTNGTAASRQMVIVKADNAETRFITIETGRARLEYGTEGQTRGHNTAPGGFNVGATPTSTAVGPSFPAPFGPTNQVETFSSDGPRRVFYDQNNFAFNGLTLATGGGIVRQKPDITAADGAPTTTPGFSRFFGTSAAAPHAAAISGLVKLAFRKAGVANPRMTSIRTAMQSTATDIEAPGVDRDSGHGVVDALRAVQFTKAPGGAGLDFGAFTATESSSSNGNGFLDPQETANLTIPLVNVGVATASDVTATLTTDTPGVVILAGSRSYGNIAPGATGNSAQPFSFRLESNFPCASDIRFRLTLNYAGAVAGVTPQTHVFKVGTGRTSFSVTTNLDPTPPPSSPRYTASTTFQTNERLSSGRSAGACGAKNPDTELASAGNRRVDTYTIMNNGPARCITVALNPPLDNGATDPNVGNSINVAAYSTYNPANPAGAGSNHLGDLGGHITSLNGEFTFSFTAPANASYTLVVYERNAGIADASAPQFTEYRLTVSGLAECEAYNAAGAQQDVTEVAPVVVTSSQFVSPSQCQAEGYSTDIVVNARVTNNSSQTLNNVVFQVAALGRADGAASSPPYRLITADGATCTSGGQVGAIQDGPDTLAPGQTVVLQFRIAAPSTARYRFSLRTLATVGGSAQAPAGNSMQTGLAAAAPIYESPLLTALLRKDNVSATKVPLTALAARE